MAPKAETERTARHRRALEALERQPALIADIVDMMRAQLEVLDTQYEMVKEGLVLSGDNRPAALILHGQRKQARVTIEVFEKLKGP